jgi:hypothetical protein
VEPDGNYNQYCVCCCTVFCIVYIILLEYEINEEIVGKLKIYNIYIVVPFSYNTSIIYHIM